MWPHKEVHQKSLQATHGPQASWQANAQTRWPPNQKLRIQSWLWFSFPGGLIPELSPSQGYEATSAHGHAATCTWADDISAGPQSAITRAKEGMVPASAALASTTSCPLGVSPPRREGKEADKSTGSFCAPGTVQEVLLVLLNPHISARKWEL